MINKLKECFKEGIDVNIYNLLPVSIIGVFAHISLYFYHLYFLNLKEAPFLRSLAVLMCLISIIYCLYLSKRSTRINKFFPLYWHLMLITILPLIITHNLILNDFHYIWLWWMIFMPICLSIFIPNWIIYAIDLLLGIILGILINYFSTNEPFLLDSDFDYISYMLVFSFTTIAGVLFVYGNRKAWLFIQSEQHRRLSSLAGSIAHELRNPLGAMKLATDNLSYNTSKTQLINFKRHVDKTIALAGNVIDMTLQELGGKMFAEDDFHYYSAQKSVIDAIIIYGYKSNEEKEKIFIKLGKNKIISASNAEQEINSISDNKDVNFILSINDAAFKYILFNIVKNALFYSKDYPKSTIIIEFEKEQKIHKSIIKKFNLNPDTKKYNILSITDTGPGISEDIITKIFIPYFTSGKKDGTGLGLDFCQRIMDDFGGAIICESELKKYTKFSLLFPILGGDIIAVETKKMLKLEATERKASQEGNNPDLIGVESNLVKKNILLIDDVRTNMEVLGKDLEIKCPNFIITKITNPLEAITLIKEKKKQNSQFDLILTDIEMPEIKGDELIKRVRTKLKISKDDLPIIAYSSRLDSAIQEKSIRAGANSYYQKPKELKFLARNISKWTLNDYIPSRGKININDNILLKDKNIIIADDDPMILMLTARNFKDTGANITECHDGKDVIDLIKDNQLNNYHLIITDINMKNIGGIELTNYIREEELKQETSRKIPIIAITGESDKKYIFDILNNKVDDYLIKGKASKEDMVTLSKFWIDYRNDKIEHKDLKEEDQQHKILNVDILNSFRTKSEKENFFNTFKEETYTLINEIDAIKDNNNTQELFLIIHKIKGSTGSVGAIKLFKYVSIISDIIKNGNITKEKNWKQEIKSLTDELIAEMEMIIKKEFFNRHD
ncbi:MAG: two-component system CAI-1 autoinducer sensor kinase/phosphatase CqsS [Ulvibacter sp.]|jgi:two-component system CAI-1 autoinducer sensor kinase/phosphatase CqsS